MTTPGGRGYFFSKRARLASRSASVIGGGRLPLVVPGTAGGRSCVRLDAAQAFSKEVVPSGRRAAAKEEPVGVPRMLTRRTTELLLVLRPNPRGNSEGTLFTGTRMTRLSPLAIVRGPLHALLAGLGAIAQAVSEVLAGRRAGTADNGLRVCGSGSGGGGGGVIAALPSSPDLLAASTTVGRRAEADLLTTEGMEEGEVRQTGTETVADVTAEEVVVEVVMIADAEVAVVAPVVTGTSSLLSPICTR